MPRTANSAPAADGHRPAWRRRSGAALAVAAATATSWELARRRGARALARDPEREILERPVTGDPIRVRSADGTELHVEVLGPDGAPPIVFVHGWGMAARFWHYQLRDLKDQHRLIAFDLRGHGRSERAGKRGYTIDALADDLDAVLDECLGDGSEPVVVGHSLGGMTILAWARRHRSLQGRAAAAILANTAYQEATAGVFAGMAVAEAAATAVNRRLIASRFPAPGRSTPLTRRLVQTMALTPDACPAHVTLTEQLFFDCPVDARAGFGLELGRVDLEDACRHIDVPATVVVGGRDRLIPPAFTHRLARAIPHAEVLHLSDSGHQAPLSHHQTITTLIRDAVAAAPRAAGAAPTA